MDDLVKLIKDMQQEISDLQRQIALEVIVIPAGTGKLVVDKLSADPTAETGRIYYNTTTNKFKVCENGVWKTVTTT